MRLRFGFVVVFLCAFALVGRSGWAAESKLLNIDLSQNTVDITTGFTGDDVTLFGVKQGRGDVVIVLEGPSRENTVRRKDRVMGAWINRKWVNFTTVPSYYDIAASTENTGSLMSRARLEDTHIGVEALLLNPEDNDHDEQTLKSFRDALVRIKQSRSLYPIKPQKVTFLDDRFFRVDFHLPANVPRGDYRVRGMLIRDGQVVADVSRTMKVAQVGFSSDVNKVAQKHGFVYGLLCVFVAIFMGFLSDLLVRRG